MARSPRYLWREGEALCALPSSATSQAVIQRQMVFMALQGQRAPSLCHSTQNLGGGLLGCSTGSVCLYAGGVGDPWEGTGQGQPEFINLSINRLLTLACADTLKHKSEPLFPSRVEIEVKFSSRDTWVLQLGEDTTIFYNCIICI